LIVITKIKAAWRVFKAGEVVANPAAWKAGQIGANAVAALLVAAHELVGAFGYDIPISGEGLDAVAAGLFVVVNVVCTVVSTDKAGLQDKRKTDAS